MALSGYEAYVVFGFVILNDFSNAYSKYFAIKRCYDEIIQILFVKLKFNSIYIMC